MSTHHEVNHPNHYISPNGKYEVLDIIDEWDFHYHIATVVKYIFRARYKGKELTDYKKARFHLDRYIQILEERAMNAQKKFGTPHEMSPDVQVDDDDYYS